MTHRSGVIYITSFCVFHYVEKIQRRALRDKRQKNGFFHHPILYYLCLKYDPMIQRIQTVWLFLASATLFLLFLFPYLQFFDETGVAKAL